MRCYRFRAAAVAAVALGVVVHAAPAQALTSLEEKCTAAVAKNFAKLQSTILKATARCHSEDISGKTDSPDGCESLPAATAEKIASAKAKFVEAIAKSCKSTCSTTTEMDCVSDLSCPARHTSTATSAEFCNGKNNGAPFRITRLDWPGPYCEAILGHSLLEPTDLGECLLALMDWTVVPLDEAVYADLDETSGLTKENLKCGSSIHKAMQRAVSRTYLATASCRDERRAENNPVVDLAFACASTDPDTVATVAKELAKLSGSIAKSCTNDDIVALNGLCGTGGATPVTVAEAQACIEEMVREVATQERGGPRHVYTKIGMLNITHPDSATSYCGDGIVNTRREEHTGVGEECDGDDDDACGAGSCLPPGDVFECTCDTTPRERFIVNGSPDATDSDAGWKGASHDATHNDGFGYVTELSNCDCSEFTQATCTGTSGDSVCDVTANMAPRCSDDIDGTQTCDERGNGDGLPQDSDCYACDAFSINAGASCGNGNSLDESACESQCIVDATGLPADPETPCLNQAGCPAGQTCRGRCDNTITCNTMTEGSPLPQVSAAVSVCITLEYKTDVTGTKNIVTGESELHYTTRSNIRFGPTQARPCPLCSGLCTGGENNGVACYGRCDVSGDACLVDSDCEGVGDTTCLESDDECTGGYCSLDLRCSSGSNAGKLCRLDSETPLGAVSHDCPADGALLSSSGVTQPFGTVTTEAVEFQPGSPCTDANWHNFDCPCPADAGPQVGVPTRPNLCAGACNGGVNEGQGCATDGGSSGAYTVCTGGTEAGLPCDADADCDGGTCSTNPRECVAGTPSLIGAFCFVNANCGPGGVCADACPGARCVPLCYPEGQCNGGGRDGDPCATTAQCKECTAGNPLLIGTACESFARCDSTSGSGDGVCGVLGGVTCDITDPNDGMCAAGPIKYRCTGEGFTTIPCSLNYGTCTAGFCTAGSPAKRGQACTLPSHCLDNPNVPVSSNCETGIDSLPGTADDIVGAGECESRAEDCFVNNGFSEGGDTLNLGGSPSDVKLNAAFCVPPNSNSAINDVSGFGGPSRIRRSGAAIVNVPALLP